MWLDHFTLVEQREPTRCFQHALDDEHNHRPAGVGLVEAERDVVLQSPGQNAFAEFSNLLAILDHDGVLADQVDAADMAVEVDTHARPVKARRDLLDMRRLAGAVIPGDHDAAILRKPCENGEPGWTVQAES